MEKTLFIFGAGASADCGAPVMATFLDVAEQVKQRLSPDVKKSFDRVFDGINALNSLFAKAVLDTNNLESVFGAFEMAALLERPQIEGESPSDLPNAMRQVIVHTLDASINAAIDDQSRLILSGLGYPRFAERLNQITSNERQFAVITFNYDCCLEYALTLQNLEYDYYLNGPVGRDWSTTPILKLHGSVNWFEVKNALVVADIKPKKIPSHLRH